MEALPLPSQPLSVRLFAPSKSPHSLFLPAPTSVMDPTSFPLLSVISLDARHQALPLAPVVTPVFAFWSMMLLGPRTVLTLSITTRARDCTHPLHDFLSLTHTHSQKDDIDHAPGLFQMPRFIFGAHLCRWLGTECVFHRRRVPKLFRGSRRGVTSPGH